MIRASVGMVWIGYWLLLSLPAGAQDNFYLKDGDRVVFYGDSITDQRLYTTDVESYVVTRFPDLHVNFVHSGWGGDRVIGGNGGSIDLRLQRDVIAYHPTVVTIMLGMNDGLYRAFDPQLFKSFCSGYEHIIKVLKTALPTARITVMIPSPFDDITRPPHFGAGYNAVMVRYGDYLRDLAGREHLHLADMNTPVVAALAKAKSFAPELSQELLPDRVHPGPAGHLLLAAALLKSWNAPAMVADVEIDVPGRRVVRADGARVSDLQVDGGIAWVETDRVLPMPLDLSDSRVALALRSSGLPAALDNDSLRVIGLNAARYRLKIDGIEVGVLSRDQLEEGVNLALLPTPMLRQAAVVHGLTLQHNNLHFTRWRQIQVPLQNDPAYSVQQARDALLHALDDEEASIVQQQHNLAHPTAHQFELAPT